MRLTTISWLRWLPLWSNAGFEQHDSCMGGTHVEELRPFFVLCVYPGVQAIAYSTIP